MTQTLQDTANQYQVAYLALKDAEEALAKARATLTADYDLNGITRYPTSDGSIVAIEEVNNRTFDIERLRLVAPNAFDKVTALKVDTKAFDREVKAGTITPTVIAEVVTLRPTTRVTVGVAV